MTRYAVALGSNVGDRADHLRSALDRLSVHGEVVGVSGLYETAPVGGEEQDPYLNAVALIESAASPMDLLRSLQAIELEHGRERMIRWGPRTLDLDLVASDEAPVHHPELEIPHPRTAERGFVLRPLCDVWPQAAVGGGKSARQALEGVSGQEVDLLDRDWAKPRRGRGYYWVGAQAVLLIVIAGAMVYDGSLPGAELEIPRIVGAVVLILGLVIVLSSARRLGRSLTAVPEPLPGGTLVEEGLYAHARHPIYGGLFLVVLGASVFVASLLATILSFLLLIFFWAKASYEERQLRMVYAGYRDYRSRVHRRLIPFVI